MKFYKNTFVQFCGVRCDISLCAAVHNFQANFYGANVLDVVTSHETNEYVELNKNVGDAKNVKKRPKQQSLTSNFCSSWLSLSSFCPFSSSCLSKLLASPNAGFCM